MYAFRAARGMEKLSFASRAKLFVAIVLCGEAACFGASAAINAVVFGAPTMGHPITAGESNHRNEHDHSYQGPSPNDGCERS